MKLTELFNNPKSWILEIESKVNYREPTKGSDGLYHYLYAWVNVDPIASTYQWCYLGEHNSDNYTNDENYLGSCGNAHYWNSREIHDYEFVILDYFDSESDVLLAETELISESMISNYSENGIFNLKVGGYSFSESARIAGHTPETVNKFMESNRVNHGGKLAWNTYEASIRQNQQKLINSIRKRVELIKANGLEINPETYYYIVELDHHDREIQRHIESICDRLYDNPSIINHENWEPEWTSLFSWYDDADNWHKVVTHNTFN